MANYFDPIEDFNQVCNALRNNDPILSFVELNGSRATHYNIKTFVDSLVCNTRVKDLVISNIDMDNMALNELSRLLEQNTTLKHIFIDNCSLLVLSSSSSSTSGTSLFHDGIARFANALSYCQLESFGMLKTRYMTSSNIQHYTAIDTIIRGLAKNKTIKLLNLSKNQIGNHGAKEIAKLLRTNMTLAALHINDNEISHMGIIEICSALYRHQHQEKANFSSINTTLETLNLERNQFSSKCIVAISAMLTHNNTLTKVRIGGIQERIVNDESKMALVKAVAQSYSICDVHVGYDSSPLQDQVKYYTDLNCLGHRHILRHNQNELPVGIWSHIISKFGNCVVSDDNGVNNKNDTKEGKKLIVDCRKAGILNYYIRSKPELFQIRQC